LTPGAGVTKTITWLLSSTSAQRGASGRRETTVARRPVVSVWSGGVFFVDAPEKMEHRRGLVLDICLDHHGVARADIEVLPQEHADVALPRAVVSDNLLEDRVGFPFFRRGHNPTDVGLI